MEWGQIAAGLTWAWSLSPAPVRVARDWNHFDPFKDYSPSPLSVITSPHPHAFTLQLLISWMTSEIEMPKGLFNVQFILWEEWMCVTLTSTPFILSDQCIYQILGYIIYCQCSVQEINYHCWILDVFRNFCLATSFVDWIQMSEMSEESKHFRGLSCENPSCLKISILKLYTNFLHPDVRMKR